MAMPNSGSRLEPTPKSQIVVFSLLLLPRCHVFLLLYDNLHSREYKAIREICGRHKGAGRKSNLIKISTSAGPCSFLKLCLQICHLWFYKTVTSDKEDYPKAQF